ncbi:MAG: tetratricopeptide repeat protein [Acidiferrobacterales bacterium]
MYTPFLKAQLRGYQTQQHGKHATANKHAHHALSRPSQGLHAAAFRRGNRHFLAKNATKAIWCYQLAANAGHARAQYNLGLMYLKGEGLPRDALYGLEWPGKAAKNGDKKAQALLHRTDDALIGK